MAASDLYARIHDAVRDIPPGRVAAYGQVAALVEGCGPRQVGY
ncbi:MGMT family protein, partial [bacterium]|nr:MGMT family protein [bacterium]